jgi:hypothetical protein
MKAKGAPADEMLQPEAPVSESASVPASSENVDRIREILFGSQMREYGQRFAQLEERFQREADGLKSEIRAQLDSLEACTRQEMTNLSDRQKAERVERAESAERIARDFREATGVLERRMVQSDEQLSKDLREHRQLILDRHRNLLDELTQCVGRLETLQNRQLEEVRSNSVDRLVLADLLAEIAVRIRGDLSKPRAEDGGNGGANQ